MLELGRTFSPLLPGTLPVDWLLGVVLLATRVGALLWLTPVLSAEAVPAPARLVIVAAIAVALAPVAAPLGAAGLTPGALLMAMTSEFALGATMALGLLLALSAFSVAGALLDVQIGYSMARVYDPQTRQQVSLLNAAFTQLAVVTFFLTDAHHAALRALAASLDRFPLGRPWVLEAAFAPVIKQVTSLFVLGFAIAAPVVFCLLLTELALGVLARNLPQMNMFAMAMPIKVVVGLAATAVWFSAGGHLADRVFNSALETWSAWFSHG
jgi:flagellar biosynthesis protein FliR